MNDNPRSQQNDSQNKAGKNNTLQPNWQDRRREFYFSVRKFGWDLLGTFLLLIAILTIFGSFGFSHGSILNLWVNLLRHSFGWGIYPLIVSVVYMGIACFLHRAGKNSGLTFGRLLALEAAYFSLLAILSAIGGIDLGRAESGLDGGSIGWGLANLFGVNGSPFFVGLFYFMFFVLFSLIGFGLVKPLYHTLLKWADSIDEPVQPEQIETRAEQHRKARMEREQEEPAAVQQTTWRDDRLPPLNILMSEINSVPDEKLIKLNALKIERTLAEFGVPARVIGYRTGPTITQYAVEPGFVEKPGQNGEVSRQKVRVAQISALQRDLTLALSATRLRIEAPVPGRSYVGIEVPNASSEQVRLRPILESNDFKHLGSNLALGLGKNVSGEPVVADLAKMPHLLIAGTTNSGKSVCITAIATCLVMNNTPADLKLVLLDPKMVELVRFNGLPHLLGKVEFDINRMQAVLRWAQVEMDARYRLLETVHARDIFDYNAKMLRKKQPRLPNIVIMIDELAELMMAAPDQTERSLIRLAQMARATGIHLVVATQRPSTDVVTGLIKANFPARISFMVASSIDSRVVLDTTGAENLLGRGDMLLLDPIKGKLQRAQGTMITDQEIDKVIYYWQRMSQKEQQEVPWETMVEADNSINDSGDGSDVMINQAKAVVQAAGKASVSLLQRRLRVGFPRAARLIDELEDMGIIGPSQGSGKDREVFGEGHFEKDVDEEY
jgi:DNA segregation ATPase FtsK/SpoIIIE, S-DNA-T family